MNASSAPRPNARRGRGRAFLGALVGALLTQAACASVEELRPPLLRDRFELLYARRLADFTWRLEVDEHTGQEDAWTALAQNWRRLVQCQTLAPLHPGQSPEEAHAHLLHQTLVLEDARRRRLAAEQSTPSRPPQATIWDQIHAPGFLRLVHTDPFPHALVWPAHAERWPDELPAPDPAKGPCERPTLATGPLPEHLQALAPPASTAPGAVVDWGHIEREAAREALRAHALLSARAPESTHRELELRLRRHAAQRAIGTAGELTDDPARRTALLLETLEVVGPPNGPPPATTTLVWLRAHTLSELGSTTQALEDLARLRGALHPQDGRKPDIRHDLDTYPWGARYLEVRLLAGEGRWAEASEAGFPAPPPAAPFFAAHRYRLAQALFNSGAHDRFLALAMETFRDRAYKADPFMRLLYLDFLRYLAEIPFEPRTVALLEDLGQRANTLERVEEYAAVALDRGQARHAHDAAQWLLAQQPDARLHPRYHALLAMAAFLGNDPTGFDAAMQAMMVRPAPVLEALPHTRRAPFFAHADQQIARVMRQLLPLMAEWPEDLLSQMRRQQWLARLASHAQGFLRAAPESSARPELLELYGIMGAMLADHPRGYVAHVGRLEPEPLVLGTVAVGPGKLDAFEPDTTPRLPEVYSLTLLVRESLPPERWPAYWLATDTAPTARGPAPRPSP